MKDEKLATPAAQEGEENTENNSDENTQKQESEEVVETLESLNEEKPKEDDAYLGQKKRAERAEEQAKALQAEIEKLRNQGMAGGIPATEVNSQIKALAEEHNVDESFLAKLVSTLGSVSKAELKSEIEKDYYPKLAQIEQERKMEKAEKKFEEFYAKSLEKMPEYNGLVNKEVIKSLAFSPASAKKTLSQIIEETYGTAIQGRKSIEQSHASREPEAPNFSSPTKEDWDKIESDPKAREVWSKQTEEQIKRYL